MPESFKDQISKIAISDWRRLFDLIPVMERSASFGEWNFPGARENGFITMPYMRTNEVVSDFVRTAYDLGIVLDFDWGAWDDGRRLLSQQSPDVSGLDIETLCKLLTVIIRQDRFVDGTLVMEFEKGTITAILKSMRDIVMPSD